MYTTLIGAFSFDLYATVEPQCSTLIYGATQFVMYFEGRFVRVIEVSRSLLQFHINFLMHLGNGKDSVVVFTPI